MRSTTATPRVGTAIHQVAATGGQIRPMGLHPADCADAGLAREAWPASGRLCQINTTVGDLDGNADRVLAALADAERQGCDLAVFPELA